MATPAHQGGLGLRFGQTALPVRHHYGRDHPTAVPGKRSTEITANSPQMRTFRGLFTAGTDITPKTLRPADQHNTSNK